jgi:predicted glycogen debranching enzyme
MDPDRREWLETDGLGGFAMGTVGLARTRRYHGLLVAACLPPAGRMVLVNGVEAWLERPDGSTTPLSAQRYAGGVVHPDGHARVARFAHEPWPTWSYDASAGGLVHELVMAHGAPVVLLSWRGPAQPGVTLCVRPLLSGRDYHSLHHENGAFDFHVAQNGHAHVFRPYGAAVPGVLARATGAFQHAPEWYRRFAYDEERARGLDDQEDLASPGVFRFELSTGAPARLVLAADLPSAHARLDADDLLAGERERRAGFPSPLHRAADQYLVARGSGQTIIAGYPWFCDWGRDTFIALRGLCLATGRVADARAILAEWSGAVSQGMLPNRFPDRGEAPEYNSVDAALWYAVAVDDTLHAAGGAADDDAPRLLAAVESIVAGYAAGTRHGIRADADGLLACGEPGVQLTWMDAKIGDWVVTPRIGKPIEIQALWIRALELAARREQRWAALAARARASLRARFWDDARGFLADVVDDGHVAGAVDASLRPNQLFALGGLGDSLLPPAETRRALDAVEAALATPLGPRSLAPGSPGFAPLYQGGPRDRDAAYHQGTVWPWLVGPFVEAWVRVRGGAPDARRAAHDRFLAPILAHLEQAGLGHVSEIADAMPPHTPRGCPFQAWSLGELLRALVIVRGL